MGCQASTSVAPKTGGKKEAISKAHFGVERVIGQGGFGKVNAVIKNKGHDKGTWYAMKSLLKTVILERNHVAMVMNCTARNSSTCTTPSKTTAICT